MAIEHALVIRCDICDGVETSEPEPWGDTEHELWEKAKDAGWHKHKGKHVCPECWEEVYTSVPTL